MGTLHELLNTVADHHSLYDSLCSYFSTAVMGTGGLRPACSSQESQAPASSLWVQRQALRLLSGHHCYLSFPGSLKGPVRVYSNPSMCFHFVLKLLCLPMTLIPDNFLGS